MQNFSKLSENDLQILIETPLYIGLLIAFADGDADHKELEWIGKIATFRSKSAHHSLRSYYAQVHSFIDQNQPLIISNLPVDADNRTNYLVDHISRVKAVISQLEDSMQDRLTDSYRSLALSVAEISGGLANFFSKNPHEEKWLHLEMLD